MLGHRPVLGESISSLFILPSMFLVNGGAIMRSHSHCTAHHVVWSHHMWRVRIRGVEVPWLIRRLVDTEKVYEWVHAKYLGRGSVLE